MRSAPAFSSSNLRFLPYNLSLVFHIIYSCIFYPCNFASIAFSTPAFSVPPGLSCGVICVILRLAVLIQYRRVTDTPRDSSFLTPKFTAKFEQDHPTGATNAGGVG